MALYSKVPTFSQLMEKIFLITSQDILQSLIVFKHHSLSPMYISPYVVSPIQDDHVLPFYHG